MPAPLDKDVLSRAREIWARIIAVIGRPVVYSTKQCHPQAYASSDAWIEAMSNSDAESECIKLRRHNPRYIFDFNNAAGRIVFRRAKKKWWQR